MRRLILAALVLTACAGKDETPADTTVAVEATPALTATQAMYVGTWEGRAFGPSTGDTGQAWTQTITPGPDSSIAVMMRLAGGTEDISVRITEASTSSIKSEFGPYRSPAANNAEFNSATEGRIDGDSIFGTFVSTPVAGGNQMTGRFVGRRAN